MSSKNKPAAADSLGREFVITREFAAPRSRVFQAWTDPVQLAQWWGPRGFTSVVNTWDARPGTVIDVVMRAPNGAEFPMGGKFREIVAPRRLVFSSGAQDQNGKMLFEFLHTLTFAARKGQTLLTIHSRVTMTSPGADRYIGGFEAGMTQSLEKLESQLAPPAQPLVIERTFAAPVARVWAALTTHAALNQWFFEMPTFAPKRGFAFQFQGEKDGVKYLHHCIITEVVAQKKLAFSWRYEGHEGDSLVTIELQAQGAQTHLRLSHAGLESFAHFARKNFQKGWTHLIGTELTEFLASDTTDREIVITRIVAASRERVWAAITDPQQVAQWWGPRGFSTTIKKMEVRPGGVWLQVLHGPDGTDYPGRSVFKEVEAPARLVFTHSGGRKGAPGVSFVSTWTFDALPARKTRVTIHMVFPTAEACATVVKTYGAIKGGQETLARLAQHVAKKPAKPRPKA